VPSTVRISSQMSAGDVQGSPDSTKPAVNVSTADKISNTVRSGTYCLSAAVALVRERAHAETVFYPVVTQSGAAGSGCATAVRARRVGAASAMGSRWTVNFTFLARIGGV